MHTQEKSYSIYIGGDIKFSMNAEVMYQAKPDPMCDAVGRLWDKFKSRGFKLITVRKVV